MLQGDTRRENVSALGVKCPSSGLINTVSVLCSRQHPSLGRSCNWDKLDKV